MKSPSERGVTGAWAYQARQELGLSVEQVADAMGKRGVSVSPATIRGIESGSKKPGARLLRVLSQVLDSNVPGQTTKEPGEVDLTGLVSALMLALQAQAQALTDIRLELAREARLAEEERGATVDILARLEAQLIELRAQVDTGAGASAPDSGRS